MVHLVSAIIVGSVYGCCYALRGKDANVYRVSVGFLVALLAIVGVSFLYESQIYTMAGATNWGVVSYARAAAVYSLWLQSLLCTALSIVALMKVRHWKYLALGITFVAIFIALAYATSNATSLAMVG
jgi:hypothetical protein